MAYNKTMPTKKQKKMAGQTFVEFILLLLLIVGMAGLFLSISGKGIAQRWQILVGVITSSNPERPEMPSYH